MKQILGSVVLFLVIGVVGVGALDTGFGVKGVVGMHIASGNDWDNTVDFFGGNNLGTFAFGAGIFGDLKVANNIAIGVEALYGRIGGKFEDYIGDTVKETIPVVQVPITFKYAFSNKEKSSTYVFFGPSLYFVTGDFKQTFNVDGDESSTEGKVDNKFALGFVVGFADEYRMGAGSIVLDLRYARTIGKLFDADVFYNSFVAGLGYKFNLGK
jgi:hypothetical protein